MDQSSVFRFIDDVDMQLAKGMPACADFPVIPGRQVLTVPEVLNHLACRTKHDVRRERRSVRHLEWRSNREECCFSGEASRSNVGGRVGSMAIARPFTVEREILRLPLHSPREFTAIRRASEQLKPVGRPAIPLPFQSLIFGLNRLELRPSKNAFKCCDCRRGVIRGRLLCLPDVGAHFAIPRTRNIAPESGIRI